MYHQAVALRMKQPVLSAFLLMVTEQNLRHVPQTWRGHKLEE
jgi:hypothetical protein